MEQITYQDLNDWLGQEATTDCVLNKLERVSIRALIAYAAYEHGVNEDVVLAIVAAHFGVNDFSQIQRTDYDNVVRYLLDVNPKEIIN